MEDSIMKRLALIFTALCVCLTISCNKEVADSQGEVTTPEATMQTITITASMADTKTAYTVDPSDDTKLNFSWTTGDEISVKCTDGNFYTFTANSSGATTTFTGSIPSGYALDSRAYFPADANHSATQFNIPKEKDLTAHPSADIPMVGIKGDGDSKAYTFTHCCGAACLTIDNIPDGIVSVSISIVNASLKLSGLFTIKGDEGSHYWDPEAKDEGTNNTFIRKVVVSSNSAKVYLPYSCEPSYGNLWGSSTIGIIGYDSVGTPTTLLTGKTMGSLGAFTRAHVKPVAPLVLSRLGFINWNEVGIPSYGSVNERIVQWQATSDPYYIYFRFKITASKIQWDDSEEGTYAKSYDKSYIYTGFNTDRDTGTGGSVSGGVTLAGCEARSLVYPFKGTTKGTIEYKTGDDPRSYIQCPIETSSGKVTTKGALDGSFAYIETAILRSKIGSPTSGTTIDIQHAMDYYPTETGSLTLQ